MSAPPGLPEPVRHVANHLRRQGFPTYLAGGCVRDMLLGRTPRDWDLATQATGEKVASSFSRVNQVGIRHETVGVYEGGVWIELTTFRDANRTIEGDLALRDFTVNAIALDPENARYIDPLSGRDDLALGRLRACGKASERMREDPLRVLRAARFIAELGFVPDTDVTEAGAEYAHKLSDLAVERIRDEWNKLMLGCEIRASIEWMRSTGVLETLFPFLLATRTVAQNRYHRWDVYTHSVETVARSVPESDVRFAALFHDLGKPATRQRKNDDYTFYNHERVSAEIAEATLKHYRFSQAARERIVALVANHMFHYDAGWSDAAVRRFLRRVEPELLESLFKLRMADSSASGMMKEAATSENLHRLQLRLEVEMRAHHALKVTDLALSGHDVMLATGASGPLVGVLLRALLERVTDEPALNTRDHLLRETERIYPMLTLPPSSTQKPSR